MTIISPFTLAFHRQRAANALQEDWLHELRSHDARLADDLARIPKRLQRSLVSTVNATRSGTADPLQALREVLSELTRRARVTTVGLWDMGAGVGYLPEIIKSLNDAQDEFVFFNVIAPTPVGIVSRAERVARWAAELGTNLDVASLNNNVLDKDFFVRAEPIRYELGIHYLVGLVPSMVAGDDDGEVYWNHFSNTSTYTILASTYDLRLFAAQAKRPFEVAVALVALAALLVSVGPELEYHTDTGCLFDYNQSRISIIANIRAPKIDADCLLKIPARYRKAAKAFVEVLTTFIPSEARGMPSETESTLLVRRPGEKAEIAPPVEPPSSASEWERQAARFLTRLLAHDVFQKQPELAVVAVAELAEISGLKGDSLALTPDMTSSIMALIRAHDPARAEEVALTMFYGLLRGSL